ncbi:MAG: UDP-N-acetylmuramate dehydrogenase, partial [Gammaproteobacteria bacterium]|nr:UDP-N-acetylmuramate dehydrogenase [Gammaproteobacteria bacterium]
MIQSELQTILQSAKDNGLLKGSLKLNESLSRYTTWRIGGEAECFYQPENEADLQRVIKLLPEETFIYWLGLGSNLLVRDGGVKGLIIYTNGVLNDLSIECSDDGLECQIKAGVGVACAIFARKSANKGINGAEFLSGIPGTIGGALAMNAGAFGGETWSHVTQVRMINSKGEIVKRTPNDFSIQYRKVEPLPEQNFSMSKEWFLSGTFEFEKNEQGLEQSKKEIKRLLAKRAETQPTKQANAGSVFKNPAQDYAARLIEECGLKGLTI